MTQDASSDEPTDVPADGSAPASAADGDAVDRGDGRLAQLDIVIGQREHVARRHAQAGLDHLLEIAPGAERLLAAAGEDGDPRGIVRVNIAKSAGASQ